MYKLKVSALENFLRLINVNCRTFKNFDVIKLADYLEVTSCLKYNNRILVYKFYEFYNYTNVSTFSKLPRCLTFYMAEHTFLQNEFNDECLYRYDTPIAKIKIEYCQFMLSIYPDHTKTKKVLAKLETEHPEYFI